jgi:hypothetical protein
MNRGRQPRSSPGLGGKKTVTPLVFVRFHTINGMKGARYDLKSLFVSHPHNPHAVTATIAATTNNTVA